uniref:Uncharacterized protein n=1 Tax=Arundo donax TaxID=35708 RepID=A0A0A8YFW6_ARUDO
MIGCQMEMAQVMGFLYKASRASWFKKIGVPTNHWSKKS